MTRDPPISDDSTYAYAFQCIAPLSGQAKRELLTRIDTQKKKIDLITKIHSFFMYET